MTTEILSNLGVTTVGTTMASSLATTLVVTAAVGALATLTGSQQCRVTVGSTPATAEIMIATAVTGTSITVTRGAEGTSGNQTAWAAGTPVLVSLTAASVQAVINQTALAGAATGTIAAVTLAPSSDGASAIGTSSFRYTNVVTNQTQIFASAGDANPVFQYNSSGIVMGAGGGSAVDLGVARSSAGTLAVTNGSSTNLATIASALLAPGTDATQALGSTSLRFTSLYASSSLNVYTSATDNLAISHNGLVFAKGTASPGISQSAQTTDTACNNLTLTPQAPWASASTNVLGGNVVVSLATPISGSGESNFQVQVGGSFIGSMQLLPSYPSFSAVFLAPGITPSSTNYALISSGSTTAINSTSTIQARINGITVISATSSQVQIVAASLQITAAMVTPVFNQQACLSDVATTSLTIQSQAPYASASTNINSGALIIGTPAAVGAGVPGAVQVQVGGVTYAQWTASGPNETPYAWSMGITTGTATLTAAQYVYPIISVATVSLTGALSIVFPSTQGGIWTLDLSKVTFGSYAITVKCGSGSAATTVTASSTKTLWTVCCPAANVCVIG